MVTMMNMLHAIETNVDILVKCDLCGRKHNVLTSDDSRLDEDWNYHRPKDRNWGLTYKEIPQPCGMAQMNIMPRFSGLFAIIENMRAQLRNGRYDEDHNVEFELRSSDAVENDTVEPVLDYYLAAKYNMKRMLDALLPYTIYLTQNDKCSRVIFFIKLCDIDHNVASSWAKAAFQQHSGSCYLHDDEG